MKYLKCYKCLKNKPVDAFAKGGHAKGRDGKQLWCRQCMSSNLRYNRHNLTAEQYEKLLQEQDYKCAICYKPFPSLSQTHIDHDHNCCPQEQSCDKCRRGIICQSCNHGLGNFQDDRWILQNAIEYLTRYKK